MQTETIWIVLTAILLLVELWAINKVRKAEGKSSNKLVWMVVIVFVPLIRADGVGTGGAETHRSQSAFTAGQTMTADGCAVTNFGNCAISNNKAPMIRGFVVSDHPILINLTSENRRRNLPFVARGFIPVGPRSGPKTCTPFPKALHTARITATSPQNSGIQPCHNKHPTVLQPGCEHQNARLYSTRR